MTDDFLPVKSAIRTLNIVDLLTKNVDGLAYVDIQERLQWPRSSTYNLLRTMVEAGYLAFDEVDRKYRIGLRLWEAGQAYVRGRDLARLAQPYLHSAQTAINETVQLAILDDMENIYIAKVESKHPLKLVSEIGSRLPAYATGLGKVLLAGLDTAELDRRLAKVKLQRFTKSTIVDKEQLRARLDHIREQGYGTDDGEYTAGVFCVAVPIRDASGAVIAAISSSVPDVRITDQLRSAMIEVLSNHASRMSTELGYSGDGRAA
ncbi:IclR family transcriptional regulator [Kribbella pittospori]|uniref:IclR family transcriptional regulator n=1 Tax=Kribbella pittospori TaxID=722689 RepID=A0A4R0JWQ0_9ACTN|nr:IclR family transcriptional regulator [Kribbella pittospori]TCC51489.1 IclR family transcriptional regulator [Kribbella pittospori]